MGKLNSIKRYSFLILSAGINKRFKMKNFDKPKSLLKINNESLLEIILKNLKKRKIQSVNIVVGYKHNEIRNEVKKFKIKPRINYIKINDYDKYGSGYSIFKFRDEWKKSKKPLVMMHSDLYCEWDYFDKVLNDKNDNIIGITNYNDRKIKKDFLGIDAKKKKILSINYVKNLKNYCGQISCINKFSKETTNELFKFMKNYFLIENNKQKTWELVLDDFIKTKSLSNFFSTKKNYKKWHNINEIEDYLRIKNLNNLT